MRKGSTMEILANMLRGLWASGRALALAGVALSCAGGVNFANAVVLEELSGKTLIIRSGNFVEGHNGETLDSVLWNFIYMSLTGDTFIYDGDQEGVHVPEGASYGFQYHEHRTQKSEYWISEEKGALILTWRVTSYRSDPPNRKVTRTVVTIRGDTCEARPSTLRSFDGIARDVWKEPFTCRIEDGHVPFHLPS